MFYTVDGDLENAVRNNHTIKSRSLVIVEWNINDAEHIVELGNYRNRWFKDERKSLDPDSKSWPHKDIQNTWDEDDQSGDWTDATICDVEIEGPYDENLAGNPIPTLFQQEDLRFKFNYSLDDCFSQHRPRSGVNYPLYFSDRFFAGLNSVESPRYYLGHRSNAFKYWTSFRYVDSLDGLDESDGSFSLQQTMGLSKDEVDQSDGGGHYIHDVAPFVVYDDVYPTNNIVVKMQTNMSKSDLGAFGYNNSSLPQKWRVEKLNENNEWTLIKSFDTDNELRLSDNLWQGYFELNYGIIIDWPSETGYSEKPEDKRFLGYFEQMAMVPEFGVDGDYFVLLDSENEKGTCYVWLGKKDDEIDIFVYDFVAVDFDYGWYYGDKKNVGEVILSDFTSPPTYLKDGVSVYRDFDEMKGLRIVVDSMVALNKTFDLIELSPRLVADITDRVQSVDTEKAVGVVDTLAIPVGGFQAGTGNISLLDYDMSFHQNNENSIISRLLDRNTSFYFYDNIVVGYNNNYIPVKKLFNEFKVPDVQQYNVSYSLRDSFYRFENMAAPEILLSDVSLSYAVGTILDLVGYTNYVFKRLDDEDEPVIPYVFVNPEQNVAEVLEKLAVSTQSAMYFDEYNNFVVMYKEFLMSEKERPNSQQENQIVYFNGNEPEKDEWGVRKNAYDVADGNLQLLADEQSGFPDILPNIIEIASDEKKVYNSGTINYTTRHLERSVGSLSTAEKLNRDQNWKYKPALLWEVSASDAVRTINDAVAKQSAYALGAMPLSSPLSDDVPVVVNGEVTNNIMNFGDNVYWLPRYKGYLYAGGEIIKFDAMEYSILEANQSGDTVDFLPRNVWITSAEEYQKYFVQTPFNGKIYPTGRVRIWTELKYDDNNVPVSVKEHGRAQFSTTITSHTAGIDPYWTNNNNCYGYSADFYDAFIECTQEVDDDGLVDDEDGNPVYKEFGCPAPDFNPFSFNPDSSVRRGYIKNFARDVVDSASSDLSLDLSERGMVQASALYFKGPELKGQEQAQCAITYVNKGLNGELYSHFGTRMRIVGEYADSAQIPLNDDQTLTWEYGGQVLKTASGGIGFGLDNSGNGYYLELRAVGYEDPDSDADDDVASIQQIDNVILWKKSDDVITKINGGVYDVKVDSGDFVGQQRMAGEQNATTVYDIAVEYHRLPNNTLRFFVFVNNAQAFVVDDKSPANIRSSIAPFVRGSSAVMFENIYALQHNITENREGVVVATVSDTFSPNKLNNNSKGIDYTGFAKYGLSGFVQQSFLSGINAGKGPDYNIYYEEFGTIMREAAYFDIKYEAYPAFISQISPTLNKLPGFSTSGFESGPYGSRFLLFNTMDKTISLDETSGNYLRVQGVTFTQNTNKEYSMDDFLNQVAKPEFNFNRSTYDDKFQDIKRNRSKYGKVDWNISTDFLQDDGAAESLMKWLIDKTTRPRQLVGLKIFHNPLVQLGDRVRINYSRSDRDWTDPVVDQSDVNDVEVVCKAEKLFVVYNIKYSRDPGGCSMEVYLSEV